MRFVRGLHRAAFRVQTPEEETEMGLFKAYMRSLEPDTGQDGHVCLGPPERYSARARDRGVR
jgi:hypothetical protein